jgi:hypothetical protein
MGPLASLSALSPRGPRRRWICRPGRPPKSYGGCIGAPSRWRRILPPPPQDAEEQALRKAQGIEMHLVPENRKIFRELLTCAAAVNFCNPARPPLLLVGAGKDHCVP